MKKQTEKVNNIWDQQAKHLKLEIQVFDNAKHYELLEISFW